MRKRKYWGELGYGKQHYQEFKHIYLERAKQWSRDNPEKRLFRSAKGRAKKENIPFEIELTDIIIPKFCPYLDWELTNIQGHGLVWTNSSLDRIDPSKGYIKENIQVISYLANKMKAHATQEQLKIFAKNILKDKNK